jgi:1-aminocyclopropane-1-carboxylate deaminase/D-cysteine desulfhydrase-like pyridoxal-dependent ACC family enzyme
VSPTSPEGTPVQFAAHVSRACGREVYVKRDDLTDPRYGGNKVRKLRHILREAARRRATDVVTFGAVGSHHVLATTVHGAAVGLRVHAILVSQPYSPHAEETARADVAQGATLYPARGGWEIPAVLARVLAALRLAGRRPMVIPIGGSSPRGALGYVDAARELRGQLERGEAPAWPDVMVCALGSGGTYAGLLAGARVAGLPGEVVGVQVTATRFVAPTVVVGLANRALGLAAQGPLRTHARFRRADLRIVNDQLGAGYGHPTAAGEEATALFACDGVTLDPTYTAKAAAGLIALARRDPNPRRYLFWNTLSSAPLAPLLGDSPPSLPPAVRALLEGAPEGAGG